MRAKRSSGILAHISSLPSHFGIGDIGQASYRFIDYLVNSNQSYWQFLPTGPTSAVFDHSPYMSTSAFAGSFLLISPELLYQDDLIPSSMLESPVNFSPYFTKYELVTTFKKKMLEYAYKNFVPKKFTEYSKFIETNSWLDDYALFMAAKDVYQEKGWNTWPQGLATRDHETLNAFKKQHTDALDYYRFEQFIYNKQWENLKRYANQNNILLLGDLPIYVGYDSVDVWAHQEIFCLDPKTLKPTHVAGVPPDYFSTSGQRWGNPLYDWHNNNQYVLDILYTWWTKRLAHLFKQVDTARIDHFRAFESYWAIPEENETAIHGEWVKGPGKDFFKRIFSDLGTLDIIAEDLGIITSDVEKLRDELDFPGMKVLQFAFDNNPENSFLPHNYTTTNCVVYTGTHDNNTTLGWYLSNKIDDNCRAEIKNYANRTINDQHGIHNDLIFMAMSSIARLAITPLQDILGFGEDCRMNLPGAPTGNWKWRCDESFLSQETALNFANITHRFNRGRNHNKETKSAI